MNWLVWLCLICLLVKCGLIAARVARDERAHATFKRWITRNVVADVPDWKDL